MHCQWRRSVVVTTTVALFIGGLLVSEAHARCPASVKKQILRLNKSAMEDYDLLEFESAKQTLLDANRVARIKGCDTDPVAAKTYVNLAVLYIQGLKDISRGKLMFRKALRISKSVKLDKQVATPKLIRIFNEVRDAMGISAPRPGPGPGDQPPPPETPRTRPSEPEKPPEGLEHKAIDEAPRNTPLEVTARVPDDWDADKVLFFFKVGGQAEYQAVPLKKETQWTWKGTIEAGSVYGKMLYYYIEVRKGGKPLAATGNAASPHIIMLTEPKPGEGSGKDIESPFAKKKKKKKGKKGEPGELGRIYLSLGAGLHTGYVGKWKGDLSNTEPQQPGFAMGTIDGQLEAGYFLSPSMLLSLMFKLGYAQSDHSNVPVLGWHALARFRYVVLGAEPGNLFRLYVGGELGVGTVYHSLELDGKFDTFESGPGLLLGALVGAWIGTDTVGGFIEIDPKGVIDFTADTEETENAVVQHDRQHTFSLGITAGLYFRFF